MPTYVQSNQASAGSASSVNFTLSSSVAAGDTLVCAARYGAVGTTVSISDNLNGAWSNVQVITASSGEQYILGYFLSSAAGSCTITVSSTGAAASFRSVGAEYSGVGSVDQFPAWIDYPSTTNPATPSVTTTSAVQTLVAVGGSSNGLGMGDNNPGSNPSSGWTNRQDINFKIHLSDVNVSATGTYNDTFLAGNTDNYDTCIVTLAAAAPAANPTFPYDFSKPFYVANVPPGVIGANLPLTVPQQLMAQIWLD